MTPAPAATPKPPKRWLQWLARAGWVLAAVWVVLCGALYYCMTLPPDQFGAVMARTPLPFMIVLPFETLWNHARQGDLSPGDEAPDFRLQLLDRSSAVQISSFRGERPVVLVFGSYT